MYKLFFYITYKMLSQSSFNKTPFYSAFGLVLVLEILHFIIINSLLTFIIGKELFIISKENAIIYLGIFILINYLYIGKNVKLIIRKYAFKYSDNKFLRFLSILYLFLSMFLSGEAIKLIQK